MAFCRVPLTSGGKALLGLTALARRGSRGGHRALKRKPRWGRIQHQHTGKSEQQASLSAARGNKERPPIQDRLSHKGHHEKKGWVFWNVVFSLAPAAVFAVWGMRLRKELEGKDMELFRVGASAEGVEGETADGVGAASQSSCSDGEGEIQATGRGSDALDERIAKLEDVVTRLQAALDARAEARKEKGVEGGAKAVVEAEERGKGDGIGDEGDGKGTETGK